VVSGNISNSTNGAASQALSQNADDHEQATNETKSSTRTNEDIWNIVNELRSSVDHILFGFSISTHHMKPGHPISQILSLTPAQRILIWHVSNSHLPLIVESTRDPTVMPLIASKQGGMKVTLWAKMDTGADKNLISYSLIAKLGRNSDVKEHDGVLIQEVHGETFPRTQSIELDFFASLSISTFPRHSISSTQRSHLTKLIPPEMQVLPITPQLESSQSSFLEDPSSSIPTH